MKIVPLLRQTMFLLALAAAFSSSEAQYMGFPPQAPTPPLEKRFIDSPARKGFLIRVVPDKQYHGRFPEDRNILSIHQPPNEKSPLLIYRFESTYKDFDLKAVDLTGDGIEDIILITGKGRGTNVRSETLDVFRWDESKLTPLLSVPYSHFCGVQQWTYHVEILPKASRTPARLALRLEIPHSLGSLCDPSMLPATEYKEYRWDELKGRLVLAKTIRKAK